MRIGELIAAWRHVKLLQTTHCSGCGKETEWGMVFIAPVWKSHVKGE